MKYFNMILITLLSACSTSHKVEKVDTKIDAQSTYRDSKIGINADNQAILQTEVSPEVELDRAIWANNDLEAKLKTEYSYLKWCRQDMADPRLGGDGKFTAPPEIDDLITTELPDEKFGINHTGKLTIVKRELYEERLERERKKNKVIENLYKTVLKQKEDCEYSMGVARIKVGLPAKRIRSEMYRDPSGELKVKKGEENLDDAFTRKPSGGNE